MYRSLKHDKDFEVSLSYDSSDVLLPPGISSHVFALYSVIGLKDAAEKYAFIYNSFAQFIKNPFDQEKRTRLYKFDNLVIFIRLHYPLKN
jgi:hypothetical protein